MSAIFDASVATQLALITRTQDAPVAPFGYGSDISGDDDLDPHMSEVDGFSTLAYAQAIVRRLDCPRGGLPDDKNYGIDIRSYLNRGSTEAELNSLGGQIRSELTKDDRLDILTVKATPSQNAKRLTIELAVQPFDPNDGPFTLTLAVTDAAILIEEIQSEL